MDHHLPPNRLFQAIFIPSEQARTLLHITSGRTCLVAPMLNLPAFGAMTFAQSPGSAQAVRGLQASEQGVLAPNNSTACTFVNRAIDDVRSTRKL